MRLFYRWFCRVIGVGSALDMVNLYVLMLIWILGVFIIFLPEDVDSKKHRSPHRHGHHRHHHRKHLKLRHQLPLDENLSVKRNKRSDFFTKNFNATNIVSNTPWILNQTSTSLFFNSSIADKEGIVTLYRNINSETSSSLPNSGETPNVTNNSLSSKNYTKGNINFTSTIIISNFSHTPIVLNDLFNTGVNYTNFSKTDYQKISIDSQITISVIEESTTRIIGQSFVNSSRIRKTENKKIDDGTGPLPSNTSFNITKIEQERILKDAEKIFGSAEEENDSTDLAVEIPVVELIRKKRSVVTEEEEDDDVIEKTRRATLLNFNGPPISNDPEEMKDRESSNAVHVRVKRDGSELDDDRSALSSLDSTYLRNLEDSFALSALEVQAQKSHVSDRTRRESIRGKNNFDSSVNVARSKRDIKLNIQEETTINDLIKTPKSSPVDSISKNNNDNSNNGVSVLEHLANSQSTVNPGQENNDKKLLSDSRWTTLPDSIVKSVNSVLRKRLNDVELPTKFASTVDSDSPANSIANKVNSVSNDRVHVVKGVVDNPSYRLGSENSNYFSVESSKSAPADSLVNNFNSVSRNRVYAIENLIDSSVTLDSYREDNTNDTSIGSTTYIPAESFLKDVNSVSENRVNSVSQNRVNDVEHHKDNLSPGKNETETNRNNDLNKEKSSIKLVAVHQRRSPSDNSILMDDNSILRYGLNDVYPEIIQDPENPSPMVQLVRTKRFGDSFVYPEAPDALYANEVDNSRTLDEPYAEDNRIIDSMLSKVDYRSVDKQDRSARSDNERPSREEELDAERTKEEGEIREKRGTFFRRMRKKTGAHHGHEKEKKGHNKKKKQKKKKGNKQHHGKHPKITREIRDLSKRQLDIDNSQLNYNNEEEAISPHDGRRRREFEDDNDENFYSDPNETGERVRRDIQRIPEVDFNRENISPDAQGFDRWNMEGKNRDKRNSALQERKSLKNVRKTDVGQNQSNEIPDKHILKAAAIGFIRDIKQLIVDLLAKVDELYSYVTEGNGDVEQSKNSTNVDHPIDILQKVFQKNKKNIEKRIAENAEPNSADAMRQPNACWKHPTLWKSESQTSKSKRPPKNIRVQRCEKNARRKRKAHKWNHWTDWSSCSVTCGRGRQIRWRHCLRNCVNAETEMEEKSCQLPACAPGKFLGIFG